MAIFGKFLKKEEKKETKKREIQETGEIVKEEKIEEKKQKSFVPGVLLAPYVTEKTSLGVRDGKYVFTVSAEKNKFEIKRAVEKIYGVKVRAVRIINMPGKKRRLGKIVGRVPGFKKAVVILGNGQSIEGLA